MKKTIKHIGTAMMAAWMLSGCSGFLDEYSQNMAYLEKIEDLDELLVGECYHGLSRSVNRTDGEKKASWTSKITGLSGEYYPVIHLMDDDVTEFIYKPSENASSFRMKYSQYYGWQSDPNQDIEFKEFDDGNWGATYRRISVLNTLLSVVDDFRDTPQDIRTCDRVKGESLFLRAQNYFWLANLYGRPYCKATADKDLCIPLKVTEDIEDRFFTRTPMNEVYGQIYNDLKGAIASLSNTEKVSVYRASRDAAYALLSRVCLYMERYGEAVTYADSVIGNSRYHLLDFSLLKSNQSIIYGSSPETIFTQGANHMSCLHPNISADYNFQIGDSVRSCTGFTTSQDLLDSYADGDLRRDLFFIPRIAEGKPEGERCLKWREWENIDEISDVWAIRLPEMYLNKAEAQALMGQDNEARATLHELQEQRFAEGKVPEITVGGGELVKYIREERRRELCFEGHRWFDLRRYAVNTEYPESKTIEHVVLGYTEGGQAEGEPQGKYVLRPYQEEPGAYIIPIPRIEIEFNEGSLWNEERPQRPLSPM